jgi:hypothetical protein
MNVPQEWIDAVVKNLMDRPDLFMSFTKFEDTDCRAAVHMFLDIPFNKAWEFDVKALGEKFKPFFISVTTHQCFHNMHPLTCCSAHEILVPRINFKQECYLVCPTCGWVQPEAYTPIMF